jgi:hypothetical protein
MHDLAVAETYHAFLSAASDMHTTGTPPNADQLNDIMKTRIRDSTAESNRFQPSPALILSFSCSKENPLQILRFLHSFGQ